MSKSTALYLLVLCIGVSLIAVHASGDNCPVNQVYTECGSACPSRCGQEEPLFCTMQCIIGCRCKQGYKLRSDGECVRPEDC